MAKSPATTGYMGGKSEPKPKKVLSHMTIREGEKGGHVIEHHFDHYSHDPEVFPFGKTESNAAHEHIAKHMNMPMELPSPQSPQEENTEETGAGN